MTVDDVLNFLKSKRVIHEAQLGFEGMIKSVHSDIRIVCASEIHRGGYGGRSFWLHGDGRTWYVGFWNGAFFNISETNRVGDMALELIYGDEKPEVKIENAEFCKKFGVGSLNESVTGDL